MMIFHLREHSPENVQICKERISREKYGFDGIFDNGQTCRAGGH